ncbi:MAG: cytochrome c biogenesis protein CcsA [Anaerolineae bacterium]|nr:cytochrome c biogenesis protein CcsA [Anaerolineae bacterium]
MNAAQNIQSQAVPAKGASGFAAWPPLLRILTIATLIAILIGLYMGLGYAGTDVEQGDVQRIFYIHMPVFFGAFIAFGATVVGGIQYLRTRKPKWDTLALAGAEVGLALGLLNVVTGAIWARPIWNTWWTWDPRLTSAAIMCLTYAAYLMLRNGIENPEQRRRFAAVYGILAIVTVIMTLVVIRIRPDTIHPAVIGPSAQNAQGTFELEATRGVGAALGMNFPVWALLVPITLMWHRIRLQNRVDQVEAMKAEVLNQ